MLFVGVDPSKHTGVVILDEDGKEIKRELIEVEEENEPQHFITTAEAVTDIIMIELNRQKDHLGYVAIEGFSYGSKGKSIGSQFGVGWIVREYLLKHDYPYIEPSPSTLKKFMTGTGQCKKEKLILPLYKHYDFQDDDDNVRDAYVLAQIARAYEGYGDLFKYQQEAMKKVQ